MSPRPSSEHNWCIIPPIKRRAISPGYGAVHGHSALLPTWKQEFCAGRRACYPAWLIPKAKSWSTLLESLAYCCARWLQDSWSKIMVNTWLFIDCQWHREVLTEGSKWGLNRLEAVFGLQACSFASGIDTGCCHGDQLTALVLPPLADLEARKWAPPKEGVTRESLGAKLVSIPAREKYAN